MQRLTILTMKTTKNLILGLAAIFAVSCGTTTTVAYLENYSPEESGLAMMKITDENQSVIAGLNTGTYATAFSNNGVCASDDICWATQYVLDISPDGTELAYQALNDTQWNIMIRKAGPQGVATQRSFRSVEDFSWGCDERFYFGDSSDNRKSQISSTDAHVGSIMRQLTSNNNDINPILAKDKTHLFFTRIDKNGSYIWCYNLSNGSLTCCCRGYNPCPISGEEFMSGILPTGPVNYGESIMKKE